MLQNNILKNSISFLVGSISVLSFAPFHYSILVFVSLGWLFYSLESAKNPKNGFWHGFYFALGLFAFGASWIYVSLHTFGNMVPALAIFMVFLLVLLFALITAATAYIYCRFLKSNCKLFNYIVSLPAIWVTSEWIREWIFTGFPWLIYGYSQSENILATPATISGVLGVSLLVAMIAGSLLSLLLVMNKKAKALSLCVIALIMALSFFVSSIQWSQPLLASTDNELDDKSHSVNAESTNPVAEKSDANLQAVSKNIQIVQANIAIQDKWDSRKTPYIIETYFRLSNQGKEILNKSADITVWPEAAIPFALHDANNVQRQAEIDGLNILTGVIEVDRQSGQYFNSIVYLPDADLQQANTYRKRHLVPFGEFIPFQSILAPILESLQIPMSDLSANKESSPNLILDNVNVGLSICYEDAFADEINDALPNANVLINVSEDAWFGDSLAPHQRLQMSQMRAIENSRYMVRVSNNGLSAFINPQGDILKIAPQFQQASLDYDVPMLTGDTVFSRFGNKIIISVLFLMLLMSFVMAKKKRSND